MNAVSCVVTIAAIKLLMSRRVASGSCLLAAVCYFILCASDATVSIRNLMDFLLTEISSKEGLACL